MCAKVVIKKVPCSYYLFICLVRSLLEAIQDRAIIKSASGEQPAELGFDQVSLLKVLKVIVVVVVVVVTNMILS